MTQAMSQAPSAPKVRAPGEGDRFQLLTHEMVYKVDHADTQSRWIMYEVSDTEGGGAPLHSHPWEETFYILSGELEVTVGHRVLAAPEGASLYLPAKVAHGFRVTSAAARFLIIVPGFADAFYREAADGGIQLPADMEDFLGICGQHGVRIL